MWAAASGLLLGLCVLTRSTALAFLPLAAVWLYVALRRNGRIAFAAPLVVVTVAVLTLVPWTVRNYAAYGHFVLVDTTGGYNLWLAAQGVRDEERMQAELATVEGPVGKQSYAYGRAFDIISADPGAFLAKGVKESLDLWRPSFSAEERQVRGYTLGRVPAWHLSALLVFDDLLYVAVILLALAGLLFLPAHALKGLTLLWVLLWVAMAFAFFAVTRFRLPMVAALMPWAGAALSFIGAPGNVGRLVVSATRTRIAALAIGAVAFLVVVVPGIEVSQTALGMARWNEQQTYRAAEDLLRSGRPAEALALYERANPDVADTRYGLAAARLQLGDKAGALAALRSDEPEDRFEPDVIRGEAARLSGDLESARALFNTRVVQVAGQQAVNWAWDHLRPPPADRIEIGSGLDLGYVRGFHGPERDANGRTFRWSGPDAAIRGLSPGSELAIVASGWRPDGTAAATVRAGLVDGNKYLAAASVETLPATDGWTTIQAGAGEGVTLDTNAFVPGGYDPRLLGIRVMEISVKRAASQTTYEPHR
jgi:hypothetical protein